MGQTAHTSRDVLGKSLSGMDPESTTVAPGTQNDFQLLPNITCLSLCFAGLHLPGSIPVNIQILVYMYLLPKRLPWWLRLNKVPSHVLPVLRSSKKALFIWEARWQGGRKRDHPPSCSPPSCNKGAWNSSWVSQCGTLEPSCVAFHVYYWEGLEPTLPCRMLG